VWFSKKRISIDEILRRFCAPDMPVGAKIIIAGSSI